MPRSWSWAAGPAATSRRSAPASSASTRCWWSRAGRGGLGGTCLNVGCIPSKALIHAADAFHHAVEQSRTAPLGIRVERPTIDLPRTVEWKDGVVGRLTSGVGVLLKRHRVKILQGRAEMVDGKSCRIETDTGPQVVRAEHVVLATGSVPAALPNLPFGGKVISSTEALSLAEVPERLAVVGAGYIGLELGMAYAKLGAKVTVIEAQDRILPIYDAELVRPVARRLKALGVDVLTGTRAAGLARRWRCALEGAARAASPPTRSWSPPAGAPGWRASAWSASTSP